MLTNQKKNTTITAPAMQHRQYQPHQNARAYSKLSKCPVRVWIICALTGQPHWSKNLPDFWRV